MKIAIIGAGSVGATLGRRWHGNGHTICYGVREPGADKNAVLSDHASVLGNQEAVTDVDIVVLATPWQTTEAAIADIGSAIDGKIVIDCTNPLEVDLSGLTHGYDDSGGEQVARWAPTARVVKALNTTGSNNMADPQIDGIRTVMFVAGDDDDARSTVKGLTDELGFDTIEVGELASARLLEPLAMLWISMAFRFGMGREFGLAVLRRGD